jgi:D-serine dehydratase
VTRVPAKGLPAGVAAGRNVFDGSFPLPTATLLRAELEHNIATMAGYCVRHGVLLAPHGKTTMSPQILRRQLAAGAWAVTVATAWQASAVVAMGVRRILLANEVVDPGSVRCLAGLLAAHDDLELFCYADSPASLEAVAHLPRIRVLVELGVAGGRTGLRDDADAVALARRIAAGPAVFAGVAAFEGLVDAGSLPATLAGVDGLLRRMVTVATATSDLAATATSDPAATATSDPAATATSDPAAADVIVTVGGSSYFDRVVEILPAALAGTPYRTVLRSGCYVTHDAGTYEALSPFGAHPRGPHRFREALRVWAPVLSRPEPDRAIAGLGRRDASADSGLPVPRVRRVDGVEEPLDATVVAINDQHAYLDLQAGARLDVGDLVGFGISHPCTTFDKWRAIPVVEADGTIAEIAQTYF